MPAWIARSSSASAPAPPWPPPPPAPAPAAAARRRAPRSAPPAPGHAAGGGGRAGGWQPVPAPRAAAAPQRAALAPELLRGLRLCRRAGAPAGLSCLARAARPRADRQASPGPGLCSERWRAPLQLQRTTRCQAAGRGQRVTGVHSKTPGVWARHSVRPRASAGPGPSLQCQRKASCAARSLRLAASQPGQTVVALCRTAAACRRRPPSGAAAVRACVRGPRRRGGLAQSKAAWCPYALQRMQCQRSPQASAASAVGCLPAASTCEQSFGSVKRTPGGTCCRNNSLRTAAHYRCRGVPPPYLSHQLGCRGVLGAPSGCLVVGQVACPHSLGVLRRRLGCGLREGLALLALLALFPRCASCTGWSSRLCLQTGELLLHQPGAHQRLRQSCLYAGA